MIGVSLDLQNMPRLFAEFREEIASFGFERSRVREDGDGNGKLRDRFESFERMFEGCPRWSILDILIEKQIGQGIGDDQNVGKTSDCFKNFRDAKKG